MLFEFLGYLQVSKLCVTTGLHRETWDVETHGDKSAGGQRAWRQRRPEHIHLLRLSEKV